jgi:hypothetical protein
MADVLGFLKKVSRLLLISTPCISPSNQRMSNGC